MDEKPIKILYFGIYRPTAPRDKVYLDGLKKLGIETVECVDNSRGPMKFFRLMKKHRSLRGRYDILWVGYLSTMVVPLARILTRKKIVFNALSSWYENTVIDRGMYSRFSPKAWLVWLFDFLAFHLSDVSLVESDAQKKFLTKEFHVRASKLAVVFTGADPETFFPDLSVRKRERFTVIFRGMFAPATGVEFVLEAARLLKNEPIDFFIIGWGPLLTKFKKTIADSGSRNITLITHFLEPRELRELMLSAHVMLGQFGGNPRLDRTIQHKTFEALALGMPYITRDSVSNRELLEDGVSCLFVSRTDAKFLASAIIKLKNNPELRNTLSSGALKTSKERLTPDVLGVAAFRAIHRVM